MSYDLAIIGGGPAGLMAAGRAAELGSQVIIIEKNDRPGHKLLMTGGGRCNITNQIDNPKDLAAHYVPNGRFLISIFSRFGARELINFINQAGVATKIDDKNRVFPESDKATDVLNVLLENIKQHHGLIKTKDPVKEIIVKNQKIEKIILRSGEEIRANNYLIATGGKSYQQTGSSGDGYGWLKKMGHKIIVPRPALAPLYLSEYFIPALEGLSLTNIIFRLFKNKRKIWETTGDLVFTHNGISGPAALSASRFINLATGEKFTIEMDLCPHQNNEELEKFLQNSFHSGRKLFKNIIETIVPPKMAPVLVELLKINPKKRANSITKEERSQIISCLKSLKFHVSGIGSFEQAMLTAGGVDSTEIDPRTMRSKIISNLYLAGEIIDLNGSSGGFNLQLCWSTGYIAGESASKKI